MLKFYINDKEKGDVEVFFFWFLVFRYLYFYFGGERLDLLDIMCLRGINMFFLSNLGNNFDC